MSELKFRDLRADEIDCRVAMVKENGVSLLLYKDARCDMNILDETVGAFNWQRTHVRDNANCVVSIWDAEKGVWVSKEDTGTESNTEKEKGLASDSFKRACFNWGIGRELYTAPFIWVPASSCKIQNGKCYDKFTVQDIKIKDKRIVGLSIANSSGNVVFTMSGTAKPKATAKKTEQPTTEQPSNPRVELREYCKANGIDPKLVVQVCGLNANSTEKDFADALAYAKRTTGDC